MSRYNLTNIIQDPTRVTDHSSTLIDPIIVNNSVNVIDSGVIGGDTTVSDHRATYIAIQNTHIKSTCFKRRVWSYNRADFNALNTDINLYDWDSMFNSSVDINSMCLNFTNTFIDLCTKHIPNKIVTIRPNDKVWFDSDLRLELRKRDRFRKKAIKTHKFSDWQKYKGSRNKVNNMKKHARLTYYSNLENIVIDSRPNPKAYWKLVRNFMKETKVDTAIPPLEFLDAQNETKYAYDNKTKARILNTYFCSVSNIDESSAQIPDFNIRNNNRLTDILITEQDIKDQIKVLQSNKAVGNDFISHIMLKGTCESIAKPLTYIFRNSIQSGVFPSIWKQANVVPIFKKGNKHISSNYRPISLLSCVGKLFERVVFKYTYNFLHSNKIFYELQSGFLPGRNTDSQLIEMYHSICKALNENNYSCVIFCDFSKAFDRVWHRGLLLKLKCYGIDNKLLAWFESYITGRQQRVIIGTDQSEYEMVKAGVPQGSVLGPLLFLIYVNDISDSLISITRLFADDTSLQHSSRSLNEIENTLNTDLISLNSWSNKWLMKFNTQKTHIMISKRGQ